MTFARRIYTKEFRINAAKLVVDEHRPATSVAEELNVSPKTLHSWVKQYREGSLQTASDKHDSVSPEQAETARLRAELQKARAEILLLKKYSRRTSRKTGSEVRITHQASPYGVP